MCVQEENEEVTSKLEAMKFSNDSELDNTTPYLNRAESECSEEFFDAEGSANGPSLDDVIHSDIEEESDYDDGSIVGNVLYVCVDSLFGNKHLWIGTIQYILY